ncbi:hypothetical protein I6J18_17860 [Peribacillus psychrosaccharolyticus]|uniref:Cytosolic protein n=1 Tax=Peribacillus psychrosaccharolyticus TaxID=1407 RepID=A0A974NKE1_PERPY|nr:DUF6154 family protein [Peribacillus psychrosaccharolyticus]MEC2054830.1 DUF6154 family protein [Peribacillus psychrosaccharolyticus]MED3743944.1 DUF6154 family protein [Peribacillus psychrosaccharolyticus]QQS99449.1 hypothetical protein I6J18_17860 [Peribacillus psychrosaccharolyticus]
MKLIEELYNLYRNKLTGDEEDIDMLAFAVLEQLNREEILELLQEMDDQELNNLLGIYIIESLKGKFTQDSMDEVKPTSFHQRNIH